MSRVHPSPMYVNILPRVESVERRNYSRSVSAQDVLGGGDAAAGVAGAAGGGRRRTWTIRNNAARQMAVNFMPSRQPQGTMRLSGERAEDLELLQRMAEMSEEDGGTTEGQADVIVREMEQDQELMQDNPEAEELRREALRELPQCLTMKRTVRAKISASVSLKSKHKPIPFSKRLKYRISFAMKRMRERSKDLFFSIELWYEAIRTIEGHFGSAVGSYFYFLRSLFIINLLLSIFLFSFVVLPQILHDGSVEGGYGTAPTLPDENMTRTNNAFLDLLSGQGIFEDTVLFYGHYHSGTISDSSYNMTFAYFFTMVALYLFFFGVLSARTAWSYRRNFIETAGGLVHVYAAKVFCGWDFGIATPTAAAINSRSIYNELQELLSEQSKEKIQKTTWAKIRQFTFNLIMNVMVLAVIAGVLTLFWWLLDEWQSTAQVSTRWPLAMAAIVTAVLTAGPLFFSRVVRYESYGARASLYVTLARTFLLDAATLLLLLIYWFRRRVNCWETMLGQEIYRLIVLDVLFSVVLIPLFEFIRGFIYLKLYPEYALEFDLAYNSLTLVYNQALLWLGMLFSPPLAFIVSVKMFLTFYVRRSVVMRVCRPARKVWRAAQTQTVLNMLVYLSILGTLFVLGYVFMRSASQQCGPFQHYVYVYMVFTEGVLNLSHHVGLQRVLTFITRPGVIGFFLVFLCVGVYYMRARALAQQVMVAMLREMHVLEAKDKEFLLSAIAKVSNGEWLYSAKPEDTSLPNNSHTWRYLHDDNIRKPSNAGFHFGRADNTPATPNVMGRPKSHAGSSDKRPNSYFKIERPSSFHRSASRRDEDGDTDSSFSWQGSTSQLNTAQSPSHVQEADKKWL